MQVKQPFLCLVAAACVTVMYHTANTSGTSFVWLSAFAALMAFFVRVASGMKLKLTSDGLSSRRRINAVVAYSLLFASFFYGLRTVGPVRFMVAAGCVAGLPSISCCRKGPRFAKLVCTALCSLLIVVIPDPAQATTPSFIFGAIGVLCVALAGRLAVSEVVKSTDASALLISAVVLGLTGLGITVIQRHASAVNEMANLLFFSVAALGFAAVVAAGVIAQATVTTMPAALAGCCATSLLCSVAAFPPFPSKEIAGLLIALVALTGAHKGLTFSDGTAASTTVGTFDPAQLFKKTKAHAEDSGVIATLLVNSRERKLFIFLLLTVAIMLLEFVYGVAVNSLGLISDSFHMMLDGTSIAIGLYAAHAASWRADEKTHPFGYARYEVFGGFVNGVLLLFIALYVTVESVQRIIDPPEIEGPYLLLVSVIGLVVNIIGVVFFHEAHGHSHSHSHGEGCGGHVDHNMRGVYLHILADLLGSVSVIISSIIIYFFNWWIADPICSALSAVLILLSAFPLLEETGKVLLLAAPDHATNYSDELRATLLDTGLLQDVATPTLWVHSTPPRELLVCTVACKLRSGLDYSATRKKLMDMISSHITHNLDAHNVSIILHLE